MILVNLALAWRINYDGKCDCRLQTEAYLYERKTFISQTTGLCLEHSVKVWCKIAVCNGCSKVAKVFNGQLFHYHAVNAINGFFCGH